MWRELDLGKIQKCVENKSEFDKVFPGLLLEIKNNIDKRLEAKYPGKTSWFGPDCRPHMMKNHPELKEPLHLDWICFGFEWLPIGECHVGLLFDLHNWPVKYHMGIHAYDYLWQPVEDSIKAAREEIAGDYTYSYKTDVTEHQLDDIQKELDFSQLDAEIVKICDRLEKLYDKARPIFKSG
jgi:hypothetical protein